MMVFCMPPFVHKNQNPKQIEQATMQYAEDTSYAEESSSSDDEDNHGLDQQIQQRLHPEEKNRLIAASREHVYGMHRYQLGIDKIRKNRNKILYGVT
jgi:hypothetical protein